MDPNTKEFHSQRTTDQSDQEIAAPSLPGGKGIEGLRQQIIDNAINLFPRLCMYHKHKAEAFGVVLSTMGDGKQYIALRTHTGEGVSAYTAAYGAKKETANAALCSLVEVTAYLTEKPFIKATRGAQMEERGGVADKTLLP